jgi:uncharacterized protein (DUF1501 family)
MTSINRREFLAGSALAAAAAADPLASRVAFAGTGSGDARFVLVIMRGAVDGLATVPPWGDADYAHLRGELALAPPGTAEGVLRLDGVFGLHPKLAFLHDCHAAGELVAFHAVASPYRDRSHFDGQDVLENGTTRPHALQSGWLNRALAALPPSARRSRRELGVALGQNVPLVMRGPAEVASWSPSHLAALDADTLQRIQDLYASDPLLSQRLADGLAADAMVSGAESSMQEAPGAAPAMQEGSGKARGYAEIVAAAAGFLRHDEGPRVAVFDTLGWDTHANEGAAQGQLAQRLAVLDAGLRTLKEQMGPAWRSTAVLLVTEFGRTAAVNGTRGTDHGTATAALLVGGAVRGGRVIADWPGLSRRALYQQRDVAPTLDLRSVLKGALFEHLRVPARALQDTVFPQSQDARPLRDLFRT